MAQVIRGLAHLAGGIGAIVVVAFGIGLAIPPAQEFPDSLLTAFHTFFVGVVVGDDDPLPGLHDPDWMEVAEPGDILFLSSGQVAWGMWSHVAVVVEAPEDARFARPGSVAVLDASIHNGMYVVPLDIFASRPNVVVRRASDDPAVRARIAEVALEHRDRVFTGVARPGAPYSNCTKAAIEALEAVGLEPDVTGWRVPDELWRAEVWVDLPR